MKRNRILIVSFCCVMIVFAAAYGQHRWTNLDGPYWVNGIDVAYGYSDDPQPTNEWYRYLIGSDGNSDELLYWKESESLWNHSLTTISTPNKVISYRFGYDGNIAFCSVFGGDVWKTVNGGRNWDYLSFPGNYNNHFSTVEVRNSLGGDENHWIMAGAEANQGLGTTYIYHTVNQVTQWDVLGGVNGQGNPLFTEHVYDLEDHGQGQYLIAATDNGIYRRSYIFEEQDNYQTSWGDPVAFDGWDVPAIATTDGHHAIQIAAVIDPYQNRHLYFSNSYPPWDPNNTYELFIDGNPFDKEVRDLEAAYFGGNEISCYAATNEGAYIIHFDESDPSDYRFIDLKAGETATPVGFHPMFYDQNTVAIDCYHESDFAPCYLLIATPFNVYEVIEEWDGDNVDLTMRDAVTGAYLADVKSATLTSNVNMAQKIYSVTGNGLIKEQDELKNWNFVGKAFTGDSPNRIGTGITTDFSGQEKYVLASSNEGAGGAIMYSSDQGSHWVDRSQIDHPIVNTLDLDPVSATDAYSVGSGTDVWKSTNNGFDWLSPPQNVPLSTEFTDIYPDPDPNRDAYNYACGYYGVSTPRMFLFDGSSWSSIATGFSGTRVNQVAKSGTINWLYAATDVGLYKASLDVSPTSWAVRTNGIGTPNLGSIVADKSDPLCFLASTAPGITPPHIWATGDSGRSWIDLPLGDIPGDASINRLAVSEDNNDGFVASTDKGVYYIGDIFQSGEISQNRTWGPGIIIVNGDVNVREYITLSIRPPCTVYFTYGFDRYASGADPSRAELYLMSNAHLDAIGNDNDRILFTSSKATGKAAGDWYGIRAYNNVNVDLQYCDIEYAIKGLEDFSLTTSSLTRLTVYDCSFRYMQTAGINLSRSSSTQVAHIEKTDMTSCGTYGIRVWRDSDPDLYTTEIIDCEIVNCAYGIWYSGNSSTGSSKKLKVSDSIVRRSSMGGNYGIYVTKYSTNGNPPIVELLSDSVTFFSQGGIFLNSVRNDVGGASSLMENKVKQNGSYGLYLSSSSPLIGSNTQEDFNAFNRNQIGIFCNKLSNPKVRSTKIKENTTGGVLIEARSTGGVPDFGSSNDGNNSIHTILHGPTYYDMKNLSVSISVPAEGNWWGEPINPDPAEIVGPIDYYPHLGYDPLPGLERRDNGQSILPELVDLRQNYPNPFNPTTEISFALKTAGNTSLRIFNICGQLVKTLISGNLEAGEHRIIWDGRNCDGQDVSSGVYFYVLTTDYGKFSKPMTLLR
jgi:hypothetical protein